jgi:septal ring factor EnvC (AmiA/AmiB activator)
MARTRKSTKNNHLEEAMAQLVHAQANLVQSQAQLAQQQTAFLARLSETDKELAALRKQTDERFARIEGILFQLIRMVQDLPEAVKDKIGFNPAEP